MSGIGQIGEIFSHTPIWVWVLFGVLMAIGALSLRPRIVAPQRLLITPIVFIAWGLISLLTKPHFTALLGADWLLTLGLGMAAGWSTTRLRGLRVDRVRHRAHLPGSPALLLRIVTVFVVKYTLNVAIAISPEQAERLTLWDVGVSGLMAGYFIGWLLRFRARYRVAPDYESSNAIPAGAAS